MPLMIPPEYEQLGSRPDDEPHTYRITLTDKERHQMIVALEHASSQIELAKKQAKDEQYAVQALEDKGYALYLLGKLLLDATPDDPA